MNNTLQKISVTILGQTYAFETDVPKDMVLAAIREFEALYHDVRVATPGVDEKKLVVLAAIRTMVKNIEFERTINDQLSHQNRLAQLLAGIDGGTC